MIIDAHSHVLPRDFPDRDGFSTMGAVTGESARVLRFGGSVFRAQGTFFGVARRIEALDAHGIREEIVSLLPSLLKYTVTTPEDARFLFRHANDAVAEYVRAGGGRLLGLGAVPLQDPDLAASELGELANSGLRCVEVASQVNGCPVGDLRGRRPAILPPDGNLWETDRFRRIRCTSQGREEPGRVEEV